MMLKKLLAVFLLLLFSWVSGMASEYGDLQEKKRQLETLLKEQRVDYLQLWKQHENLRDIYNFLKLSSSKISKDLKKVEEQLKDSERRLQSKINSLMSLERELAKVKRLLKESKEEMKGLSKSFEDYKSEQFWAKVKVGGVSFLAGLLSGMLFSTLIK